MDPLYWHISNIFLIVYVYFRRNRLCLLRYSSRQPYCDIIFCEFAYLLEKTRMTRSHESAFQWHRFLFLFGVLFVWRDWLWPAYETQWFGLGAWGRSGGIINTPNRNRAITKKKIVIYIFYRDPRALFVHLWIPGPPFFYSNFKVPVRSGCDPQCCKAV